jgi:hypothetical protein
MIIGLVGFIGCGKGTVGDLLVQDHGFVQDSFAAPLKDAVANIFGWNRTMLEGSTKASRDWREQPDEFWSEKFGKPFSPRLALQLLGTEAGRNVFHQDIWVISLLNRCNKRGNTVVTDVRFKNEIAVIQKEGGVIVRVRRGDEPSWYDTAWKVNTEGLSPTEMIGVHQSEWDWVGSPINHIIYNDGTLSNLRDAVRHIAQNHEMFERVMPTQTHADDRIRM